MSAAAVGADRGEAGAYGVIAMIDVLLVPRSVFGLLFRPRQLILFWARACSLRLHAGLGLFISRFGDAAARDDREFFFLTRDLPFGVYFPSENMPPVISTRRTDFLAYFLVSSGHLNWARAGLLWPQVRACRRGFGRSPARGRAQPQRRRERWA